MPGRPAWEEYQHLRRLLIYRDMAARNGSDNDDQAIYFERLDDWPYQPSSAEILALMSPSLRQDYLDYQKDIDEAERRQMREKEEEQWED